MNITKEHFVCFFFYSKTKVFATRAYIFDNVDTIFLNKVNTFLNSQVTKVT